MSNQKSYFYDPIKEIDANGEQVIKAIGYNGKIKYTEYSFRHKRIGLIFKNDGSNFWFINISDNICSDCLEVLVNVPKTTFSVSWGYFDRVTAEKALEKFLPLIFENGVRQFKIFQKFIMNWAKKYAKKIPELFIKD